ERLPAAIEIDGPEGMTEVTAEMIARGRGADPKTVAQRRRLSARVREAREKLTSAGSGHRSFDVELLQLFARGRRVSNYSLAGSSIAAAAVASAWAPLEMLLIWLGLQGMTLLLSYCLAAKFLSLEPASVNVRSWRRIFVFAQ